MTTTTTDRPFIMPPTVRFTEAERLVFKPKEKITCSQWAGRHRELRHGSAQGRWSNDTTPYLIEPMDCFTKPWIRKILLCFAPQTGKTQVALNCMSYAVDQDPGPAMYIMPDEKTAKRISNRQIIPALKASPRTGRLLSGRADDVSTLHVKFRNGMDLMMAWATSPSVMASESVRYLFFDEPGKYPEFSGREADPFSLGEVRTNVYPHTKKILYFSTPNLDGDAFSALMEDEPDVMMAYQAQCPFCQKLQVMAFDNIHWPESVRDPRVMVRKKLARYACVKCGMEWDDAFRNLAVKMGREALPETNGWLPVGEPVTRPTAIGFHLPSWYSPFVSLSDVAAAFLRGLQDPKKLLAFVTQHKAESWKEVVESKEESQILAFRSQVPPGVVPRTCVALTAGIDVQKIGFWFVVRAWEPDLTSHLVQYGYLSTWADVEALVFGTRYPMEGGGETMAIWRAAMDTGGGLTDEEWTRTEEIYHWIRQNGRGVVFGVKGASKPQLQRVKVSVIDKMARGNRPIPGGLELRILDTHQFKGLIHWRMSRKKDQTQRFFLHSETGMDYARQILAEELRKTRKGKAEWVQKRHDNHLLDCEVLAAACADAEWPPSLTFLAQNMRQPVADAGTDTAGGNRGNSEFRSRPGWFERRR